MSLGVNVTTPEDAIKCILKYAQEEIRHKKTLISFIPTESTLELFDGYVVFFLKKQVTKICGYQCKANNKGAGKIQVPEWVNGGGHLLRSVTAKEINGKQTNGWKYYNESETDTFLGYSLTIMRNKA